jgi:hypothetical protein
MSGGGTKLKSALQLILVAIGVIALSAASKHVAVLHMLEQVLARLRNGLLMFTIPVAGLGFILFMGGLLLMLYEKGKPMSHTEVEEQQARVTQNFVGAPFVARRSAYRIFGKAEGRQFHEELPLKDFKLAWQSGAWRQDKLWRYRIAVFSGALMAIFAGLASAAVVSPIAISLICVAALIYAAARLGWALWHA